MVILWYENIIQKSLREFIGKYSKELIDEEIDEYNFDMLDI